MEDKDLKPSVPQEQVDESNVPVEATRDAAPAEEASAEATTVVVEEPIVEEIAVEDTVIEPVSPEAEEAVEAVAAPVEPSEETSGSPEPEPGEEEMEMETEAEAEAEESEGPDSSSVDFGSKTKTEIVDTFRQLLETRPVQSLRREAEAAKVAFYKAWKQEVEKHKKDFIAAGNPEEAFVPPTDSDEERLKELFSEYRKKRDAFLASSEEQKEANHKAKLLIIEELKALVNGSETLNQTFNTFRDLQNRWKEIGAVPQSAVKDLWDTYHLHVENFYDYVKINKELRDLDLKKNYETKIRLAEEAEALVLDPSPVASFHALQKLHEQWREAGPVANEYKESLWDRFREASSKINKRHQEYFEGIKDEQQRNLELKTSLCEQTEELLGFEYDSRKEWEAASEKLIEIQKLWKTIGFAPKKDNTKIYERFRAACDRFFEKKRAFYSQAKGEMDTNLQAKVTLCEQAEALAGSTEWKKATDQLIALQKQWKEIGPVSRKQSDTVWKRFRKACDAFFENKSKHFSETDTQYAENLAAKRALLEEIRQFEIGDREESFELLKDFQRRWGEIGFVPIREKDKLQAEYREVIDAHFAVLKGNDRDRKVERFREKVSTMKSGASGGGNRSLRNERERLYNKVKQLEADIALLENNIGFFAKSKNAEGMIREVNNKITRAKEEMAVLIEKIKVIDQQEN
jgi:hypothetical protein